MSLHQKMATHCFRSAILPRKTKNQNNLRFGHTGNVYTRKKMLLCCYHTTNTTDFIISTFFFPFFTIICYLISIFYTQGTGANWYIIIEAPSHCQHQWLGERSTLQFINILSLFLIKKRIKAKAHFFSSWFSIFLLKHSKS